MYRQFGYGNDVVEAAILRGDKTKVIIKYEDAI